MEHNEINLDAPMMVLQETTVATVNDQRIGCGNVLHRSYTLPDGTAAEGLTMRLVFAETEQEIIIGEGSTFAVGDANWSVLIIRPKSPESHYGEAVIEQIL